MKKLATTVLVVVTMLLTSCTPNEVECNCWVEESHVELSYYTASDIADCSRDGEVLNAGIEGVSEVHYILRCQIY